MNKKPKKPCYLDLLGKLDKLDMQVEGMKDQLKYLKDLIVRTSATAETPRREADIIEITPHSRWTEGETDDE